MPDARPSIPAEIARYYESAPEERRLASGRSQLEFARTKEVALRCLPPAPATILDIGGGAGPYSLWLAERGYEMHLIDASPRLVEEARRRSNAAPKPIASCEIGDARALPFRDGSAHVVLMLGPLYHLTEAADRAKALREAHRVLRSSGVLCAAAISHCASALDGIARDLFADPSFAAIMERDLAEGQHRNATGNLEYFTTAYLHRPEDLRAEVAAAGFGDATVFGLEGPGWLFADFDERWADPRRREDLMRVARALEREASIVAVSAHMLAVGTKASVDLKATSSSSQPRSP